MSYGYNGECSGIRDVICDKTGVAPRVVLSGRGRETLEGVRTTIWRCLYSFFRVTGWQM